MPGQNLIELGYDMDVLTPQQKIVVDYLTQTLALADQLDRRKIAPDISGQQDLNNVLTKQKAVLDEVSLNVKEYNKLLSDTATIQAKQNVATSEAAQAKANEKAILKQMNDELKTNAQNLINQTDAYKKLEAQYKSASESAKSLGAQYGVNDERAKQAAQNALELNDRLKQIDASIGNHQRKVGDYIGALNTLKPALGEVTQKINAMHEESAKNDAEQLKSIQKISETKAKIVQLTQQQPSQGNAGASSSINSQIQKLTQDLQNAEQKLRQLTAAKQEAAGAESKLSQEQELLNVLVNQQTAGFTSLTQEIRAGERSLQSMHAAGLESTESFKKLQLEVADSKRSFQEFAQQQKLLSSASPALSALTVAAKGLAGAYAIGAGAAALFADGDEKVQKEIGKLVAIMTVLQGLEEAHKLIMEKNAIMTATSAGWNKVLTLVYGEEAVAAATATEATGALYTVMTGGVALAIGLLVGIIYELVKGSGDAAKKQLELSDSMEKVNESVGKQIDLIGERWKDAIEKMKEEISIAEKTGLSQEVLFAKRKQLNDLVKQELNEKLAVKIMQAEKEYASSGIQGQDALNASQAAHLTKYRDYVAKSLKLSEELLKWGKYESDGYKEKINKEIEDLNKLAENEKKSADSIIKLNDDVTKSKSDDADLSAETAKLSAEEKRKLVLETTRIEADLVKARNAIVLGDERSTQSQRIAAMKSNLEEEKKIALAERNDILNNPANKLPNGEYNAAGKLAIKKYNESVRKLNIDESENERKENDTWRKRELAAKKAFDDTVLGIDINNNNRVAASDAFTLDQRVKALVKSTEDQKKIIDNDYNFQKATKILTVAELKALDEDYSSKKIALQLTTENTLISIQQSAYDKLRREADEYYNNAAKAEELHNSQQILSSQQLYSYQVTQLNNSFLAGTTSLQKYNVERKKLDEQFSKQQLVDVTKDISERIKTEEGLRGNSLKAIKDYNEQISSLEGNGNRTTAEDIKLKNLKEARDKELIVEKSHEKNVADLTTQAQKNNDALEEKSVQKSKEFKAKRLELTRELVDQSVALIQTLVDGGYQRELEAIQRSKDASDLKYSTELQNIQQSNLSNQDKAALIAQTTAQQRARDQQLEREQRDVKNRQAKADRAFAIASIVENTAMAVMSVLSTGGGAHYLDFGASAGILSAMVTGVGALELAAVLSKPIPQYAEGAGINGRPDHPGGLAVVGEGANKERVTLPTGESFITDHAMLLNLPAKTTVQPLTTDDLNQVMYSGMMRKTGQMIALNDMLEIKRNQNSDALARKQISLLEKIASKNQQVKIGVTSKYNPEFERYIDIQVRGKN